MFFGSRENSLHVLKLVGQEACQYAGVWPDNYCDCKYGVKGKPTFAHITELADLPVARVGEVRDVKEESSGCPELKSIYAAVEAMTDEEWADLTERSHR